MDSYGFWGWVIDNELFYKTMKIPINLGFVLLMLVIAMTFVFAIRVPEMFTFGWGMTTGMLVVISMFALDETLIIERKKKKWKVYQL